MFLVKCSLLWCIINLCSSMETYYMKRSILDDQESSESGYSYQVHSGNPSVFTAFSSEDTDIGKLPQFGYPPVTLGKFSINDEPHYLDLKNYYPNLPDYGLVDSYGKPVSYKSYAFPEYSSYQDFDNVPVLTGNYGLDDDNSKYEVGNGKSYKSDHNTAQGEKGESGYKNFDEYEKGTKGRYEKEGFKGHYNQEGGNKAGHYDVASKFGSKHESGKGNRGESFKQAKGHKKGSKTTGFHNVYHKDEYKKDHSFYDEADKSGHFNKYGSYKGGHASNEGSFKKGGLRNSGFKETNHGKEGFSDKGTEEEASEGYKGRNGKEAYQKDYSQYKHKQGNENGKEYAYNDRSKEDY